MIRYFCDVCGKDISNYKQQRLQGKVGRLNIEVLTAIDNCWNGGHVCEDCIKAAVAGASIPRKAPEVQP